MSVKDPASDRKPPRAVWVAAAILCLCTLVALWVTAARVKGQKLAARMGERIRAETGAPLSIGDGRPLPLRLRRGQSVAVEYFLLRFDARGESLSIADDKNRPLVEFLHLKKGRQRGWQELRLTFQEADGPDLSLEAELRPGATSHGDGWYAAVRPGLRVEFDRDRSVTVTAWDPAKGDLTLKAQRSDQAEEHRIAAGGRAGAFGLAFGVTKREGAAWGLLLESEP